MQATGGFHELNDLHYKYFLNPYKVTSRPLDLHIASFFCFSDSSMLPGPMGPWTAYDCMNSVAARYFWVLYILRTP